MATDYLSEMTLNQPFKKQLLPVLGLLSVVVGLALVQPGFLYAAYSEPSGVPPNYTTTEVPELLNGSNTAQRKIGSLLIGPLDSATCNPQSSNPTDKAGCSKLCLNPNLAAFPGVSDVVGSAGAPPSCVSSWDEISGALITGSALVRKMANPSHFDDPSPNPLDTVDNGAFSLQAQPYTVLYDSSHTFVVNPYAQLITLMAGAPANTVRGDTLRPTGIIADAQTGSNFAAQFSGRLAIVTDETIPHQICLNSPDGNANCITDWSGVTVSQDPTMVRLQNVSTSATIIPDRGNTATSGLLVTESMVSGIPSLTTPLASSCGDGICTSGNETATNGAKYCPQDCQ